MKIAMINGSPKVKESNSQYLLSELNKLIENNNEVVQFNIKKGLSDEEFEQIYSCKRIVFAFPIYVDELPSHLLSVLVELQEQFNSRKNKDIMVYAMSNCGFYEGEQNELAIEIVKNWCKRCNLTFGQGLGMGAGEMMGKIKNVPIGHGPKKNLGKGLNLFAENIQEGNEEENIYISPNFPRFAFKLCATYFWNCMGKENGLKRKDLFRKEHL